MSNAETVSVQMTNEQTLPTTRPEPVGKLVCTTPDVAITDLAGVEEESTYNKARQMLPYAFLVGIMSGSWALTLGAPVLSVLAFLGSWVFGLGGRRGSTSSEVVPNKTLLPPSAGVKKGFAALGWTAVTFAAAYSLMPARLIYPPTLFRALWVFWTWRAVKSASKTDAQTGWMAGATSMTAFSMLWWYGWGWRLGIVVPAIKFIIPALTTASMYQTWRYLSTRGTERSAAALKATVLGALAALLFLPVGAPSYLPLIGTAIAVSLMVPIQARLQARIGAAEAPAALPAGDEKA